MRCPNVLFGRDGIGLLAAAASTKGSAAGCSELARLAAPDYDAPEMYGVVPPGTQLWQVVV